jgi:hypothetical protein
MHIRAHASEWVCLSVCVCVRGWRMQREAVPCGGTGRRHWRRAAAVLRGHSRLRSQPVVALPRRHHRRTKRPCVLASRPPMRTKRSRALFSCHQLKCTGICCVCVCVCVCACVLLYVRSSFSMPTMARMRLRSTSKPLRSRSIQPNSTATTRSCTRRQKEKEADGPHACTTYAHPPRTRLSVPYAHVKRIGRRVYVRVRVR